MGGKTQKQESQSSQSYTPAGLSGLQDIWSRIQSVASQPYQAYTGQMVAGLTPTQQTGISNINSAYGMAQPYIDQAATYAQQGAASISPTQIQSYLNPYNQSVIDATQNQFNLQNAEQQAALQGNTIAQGALGGNRAGVAEAQLAGQQQTAQSPIIANLNAQNYNQALAAAQADRAAQSQAAYTYGNLGTTAQNAALQGAQAQIGAGTLEQQTQQAQLDAAYQQYLQQLAFPYQQVQFLSSLGIPALTAMGGSQSGSSTTTQPGASPWSQAIGLGISALGAFMPSDERVKENIELVGKTFDNKSIYRFNYKGDPQTHIGFLAQDIEKTNPEAVGSIGGVKTVNYDIATRDAADKGKYAIGGAVTDLTDSISYIPKVGQISIAPAPQFAPMQSGSSGSSNSSLGIPSASDLKGMTSGLKGIGELFSTAGGANTIGGTGLPGFGGLYAKGGTVDNDFLGSVRSIRKALKDGYANGGFIPNYIENSETPSLIPNFDPATTMSATPVNRVSSGFSVFDTPQSPYVPLSLSQSSAWGPDATTAPTLPPAANVSAPSAAEAPAMTVDMSARSPDYGDRYAKAIGGIESGNSYQAIGPDTGTGDRAYGKYQVMGSNVGPWTKAVLGRSLTPEQFLKSPEAQDAVFRAKFGSYVDKYGPEGAAKAWFAGEGGMNNPNARDVLGTTVSDYANKFRTALGSPSDDAGSQPMALGFSREGQSPYSLAPQSGQQPQTAQPEKPSSIFGSFNPLNMSDEARQGLIAAGLGMMASRSPSVGTAIGEGGLHGLQAYSQAKKTAAEQGLAKQRVDLQAKQMAQQAEQFAKTLGLNTSRAEESERHNRALEERENLKFIGVNDEGFPVYTDTRTGKERVGATRIQQKAPAGYVRNPDGTMAPIKGGPADPEVIKGLANAKRGEAMDDNTADFLANRVLAGDTRALIGLGRGAQGAENIAKIQKLVAQKAQENGMDASDILAKAAEQSGLTAQQRTFGTQVARMAVNATEAQGAIDLGRAASANVPRTNWVPVNKAIQMYQAGTSDPNLAKFGAANLAIINTYARAISPTGVPTVHDKEHAEQLLSTATGPEAYNAVLDQMNEEIKIAHAAPRKAKKEMEDIRKGREPEDTSAKPKFTGRTATGPKGEKLRETTDGKWVP